VGDQVLKYLGVPYDMPEEIDANGKNIDMEEM